MKPTATDTAIAVYCRCGAAWYGRKYTIGNPIIADHRERCGPPITEATYYELHPSKRRRRQTHPGDTGSHGSSRGAPPSA